MNNSVKPSILMVTYSDPDIYSPIINSARLLAGTGYQVHILGYYRGRENSIEYGDGIILERGNAAPGKWPVSMHSIINELYKFYRLVYKKVEENRYCLVIGNDAAGFWASAKACLSLNVPFIYHCHDFSHSSNPSFSFPNLSDYLASSSSKLAQYANAVIFPERARAAWASLNWKLPSSVFVIPNSPLKQPFRKSDALTKMFRKKGLDPVRIIVRKGTISLNHGLEETIKAMALCPPDWGLALIGYGDVESVKAVARKYGVEKQVLFTGFIPYDSTWDIISSAHIGLSIYRPFNINTIMQATASQKVFEYMACGIPSIAFANPDFVDLARETGSVSTIESITPEAIAQDLIRILSDDQVYEKCCSNARNAHDSHYNYENLFSPAMQFIDKICRQKTYD